MCLYTGRVTKCTITFFILMKEGSCREVFRARESRSESLVQKLFSEAVLNSA